MPGKFIDDLACSLAAAGSLGLQHLVLRDLRPYLNDDVRRRCERGGWSRKDKPMRTMVFLSPWCPQHLANGLLLHKGEGAV